MSLFQGIILTPLMFTPSNTPTFVRRSNEESLVHITAPSMSEIDHMSTTSQAELPTYIPSSHMPSPNPLPVPLPRSLLLEFPSPELAPQMFAPDPYPLIQPISPRLAIGIIRAHGDDIDSLTL